MPGSPQKRARRSRFERWSGASESIDEFCNYIASGKSLREFCRVNDFAFSSVHDWLRSDMVREAKYVRAMESRAAYMFDGIDALVDEPLPIVEGKVDPGSVQHRRLQIDTKKWQLARMHPGKFDDRISIDQRLVGEHRVNASFSPRAESERDLFSFTNAELEAFIRDQCRIPVEQPLTEELLLGIMQKSEQRALTIAGRIAELRSGTRDAAGSISSDPATDDLD